MYSICICICMILPMQTIINSEKEKTMKKRQQQQQLHPSNELQTSQKKHCKSLNAVNINSHKSQYPSLAFASKIIIYLFFVCSFLLVNFPFVLDFLKSSRSIRKRTPKAGCSIMPTKHLNIHIHFYAVHCFLLNIIVAVVSSSFCCCCCCCFVVCLL